jgi:IclR family acetate operon transcriptional repressor
VARKEASEVDGRYRVQSVGRAFDLIDKVAASGTEGARLTDLAAAVGLSKAAAYSILATLQARGVLASVGENLTRRYRLGLSLLRLGELAAASTDLAGIAMPVLRELTGKVGMTSRLAVLEDGYAVIIGRVDAPGAIRFESALGRRENPHCSGVGKALLAALPDEEATAILARLGQPPRTRRTLTSIEALRANFAEISRRRFAIDDEEDHEGVVCIAAAVFGRDGRAVGAISITNLKQRLSEEDIRRLGTLVSDHADQISRAIGGPASLEAWPLLRPVAGGTGRIAAARKGWTKADGNQS